MTLESIELSEAVTITPTGLIFKSDVTFTEWQQVGGKLKELRGMIHWWIGDWLNYGEGKWGALASQAHDETGYAFQTLANDKYVSGRFETSRRRETLSWSHHMAVASMDTAEQDRLLDIAEQRELNRDNFRDLIAARKEDKAFYESLFSYPAAHKSEWTDDKVGRYQKWLKEGEEFFK